MRPFRSLAIVALFSLLLSAGVSAEETPVITVRKSDALNVAFAGIGGSGGAEIAKVVQNDLSLAGWFSLVPQNLAAFTVSGVSAGGVLQGKVQGRRNRAFRLLSGRSQEGGAPLCG